MRRLAPDPETSNPSTHKAVFSYRFKPYDLAVDGGCVYAADLEFGVHALALDGSWSKNFLTGGAWNHQDDPLKLWGAMSVAVDQDHCVWVVDDRPEVNRVVLVFVRVCLTCYVVLAECHCIEGVHS